MDATQEEGSSVDASTPDQQNTVHNCAGEPNAPKMSQMAAVIVNRNNAADIQSVELNGDAIYLNYRQLQTLPSCLFTPVTTAALRRLYVKHNLLDKLPPEIGLFQGLTELYLHTNQLVVLPDELFELRLLEMLAVSDNQLMSLPEAVGQLHNLKRLQLSRNKLQQLPAGMGQLRQLQVLEVSHNSLRCLPTQLADCTSLRRLCLDANSLVSIPRQLCRLPNLTEISACDNKLVSLPQDLGHMPALEAVYVDNNPYLKTVPASTLHKTIGFYRSGKSPLPDKLLRQQEILTFKAGDEEQVTIPMPGELRSVGHICTNCVPLLLELAFRVVHSTQHRAERAVVKDEMPSHLIAHLDTMTARCQHCTQEIFVSAFPVIFRAQVQACDLLLLGLCCSADCVRQCSLIVNLPLIYPRLEDLALALVLA